ncbi:hypothetical protein CNR22_07380 [Sphingobacteriaceae bacterium]|nr:hypothetical protein CNR22_07380 [Sphingobacteriaceae bacterium]
MSIFFGSCNKTDLYEQKAKSLDSLSGAVSSIAKELQSVDTITLQKSISRYTWYKQFIQQNISDTVSKDEADNLQQFYGSGKNLEDFSINRKILLTRALLVNQQLEKLAHDIKNKALTTDQLVRFSLHETDEAAKLIATGYQQQKKFHIQLEEFRNSLKGIEVLIRSRNKGELPTIIKDTISF